MAYVARVVSSLTATLLAIFGGTALIVLNPSKFWDDWVWAFQNPADFIRVGIEMGAWWSGYLSAVIYTLDDPTLMMRLTALIAWIVAGVAFTYVLTRMRVLTRPEAFAIFLLFVASHAGLIRFIISASMYNVYIASFWLGWAIIAVNPTALWTRVLASVFLVFAFHLNSMLVLYGLLFLWLVLANPPVPACRTLTPFNVSALVSDRNYRGSYLREWTAIAPACLLAALRRNGWFLLLPAVFVLVVKVPSFVLVQTAGDAPNFYSGYNLIRPTSALRAIPETFAQIGPLIWSYLAIPWAKMAPILTGGFFLLYLLPLLVIGAPRQRRSLGWSAMLAGLGLLLIYAGVLPYVVVGKPPQLGVFYESRHALVAVPGIVLFLYAVISAIVWLASAGNRMAANLVHGTLLAAVLALSSSHAFIFSATLLHDWLRQAAITNYAATNRAALAEFGMVLFNDLTYNFRMDDRYILNYEYTGNIIEAVGEKRHLGISFDEYLSWPSNVKLIQEPAYRKRYNLDDFDFSEPHLILTMTNRVARIRTVDLIGFVVRHWKGIDQSKQISSLIDFATNIEFRESDDRMADMRKILAAMEAYRRDNGHYPNNASGVDPMRTSFGFLAPLTLSSPTRPPGNVWKKALAPAYIEREVLNPSCNPVGCGLVYISDGIDYKLVYNNPQDLPYVRQAYGSMLDPRRDAFGFWTVGAAGW